MRALTVTVLAVTFVFACNKDKDASSAPADAGADGATAAADAEAPAPAEAPKVWQDMNDDERKVHMGLVVMPKMKEAFAAHDAEHFADFKCQTCHGDNMEEEHFAMPQQAPLPVEGTWEAALAMDEEMTKFMGSVVVPQMGEMLNMEVKPDGSGEMNCFVCHLKEE